MSSYGSNNRQLLALPGTAAVPGFSFLNATKTGMYLPAASTLGLSTNGTNALYINSSQNVGIGTLFPTYALDVYRSAAAVQRIYSDTSATLVIANYSTDTTGGAAAFYKYRGTNVAPTTVVNGDIAGRIVSYGYDGTSLGQVAEIRANLDATVGTGSTAGRLTFYTTASGSNTVTERMRIDNVGSVGIGSTPAVGRGLVVGKNVTGSTTSRGITSIGQIQSDVTTAASYFATSASTLATAFTLSALQHYTAIQGTIGASSVVTNQYGFYADATMTGATNNYGFHSNLASGTGRYNFYAAGTADNYFAGNVGIGNATPAANLDITGTAIISSGSASDALRITQTGAGNALVVEDSANPDSTPFVVRADGSVIAGYTTTVGTGGAYLIQSVATTASAGFTAARFSANAGTATFAFIKSRNADPSGKTIVASGDQIGNIDFRADDGVSFISGATIGVLVDGTPGLNDMPTRMVFSTTADGASSPTERMRIDNAGNVGIGAAASAGRSLEISKPLTGSTFSYSANIISAVQSDVTAEAVSFHSYVSTQAAAFALTSLRHFKAVQSTIGAGSSITSQAGFWADSSLTGATNNYGFYSNIASGTNRWNFYAGGTADNYFSGNVGIGTTPSGTYKLEVTGKGSFSGGIPPRVLASTANSATPTLNTDSYDMMVITGQSVAITSFTTNLTGTPVNGQKLWIAITGTTAIAITWGASFEASTTALPTTTVTTNRLDVGFVWNAATSKWRCVASA